MSVHFAINKRTMTCRVVGGARAVDGQAECLDHILADVFMLESGVTTKGSSSLVLYYEPINGITGNTQLLYIYYFAFIGYLFPINPRCFHNMTTIAFHLNYTKGL